MIAVSKKSKYHWSVLIELIHLFQAKIEPT